MILNIAMPIIKEFDVFGFFLIAALFFLFISFVYVLYRQKQIPIWKASTLYFITVLFLLTGGKLFTITLDEWQNFFNTGNFPDNGRITILGALTFGTLGVLAGKRMLEIKIPFLDNLAIPVLFAMVIQRLGCLFAGCCGGVPTNSNFGVSYAPFTTAHRFCAQNGTLDTLYSFTPPLHPIPLYLLGICILSAFVIYKIKNRFQANGSLFMCAIALFLVGRCVVEFWREPLTEGVFGDLVLGLKGVQWVLILGSLILASIIYFRERFFQKAVTVVNTDSEEFSKSSFYNGIMVLALFVSLFISIRSHFTTPERTALFLFAFISFSSYATEYVRLYFPYYRYIAKGITAILVVMFLPIMAQVSYDSTVVNPYSYKEISVGFARYNFNHFHQGADTIMVAHDHTDCNGNYLNTTYDPEYILHDKYKHQLYAGAIGYSQYFNNGYNKSYFYKMYGIGGIDESNDPMELDGKKRELLVNLEVTGGYDFKKFGISTKFNIGRMRRPDKFEEFDNKAGIYNPSTTSGKPKLRISPPSVNVRIGKIKNVYMDIRVGTNTFGLNSNASTFLLGFGSGLGKDNGNFIRMNFGLNSLNRAIGFGSKFYIKQNAIEIDFQRNLSSTTFENYNANYLLDKRYYLGIIYSKKFGIKDVKN